MKWIAILLLFVWPVSAQRQWNFSAEDDRQAVSFYIGAVRSQPDPQSPPGVTKAREVCSLLVDYENLSWLERYSGKRAVTLDKLGIRPESVGVLRTVETKRLIQDLASRVIENRPVKENCGYGICSAGICGDSVFNLSKLYQLGVMIDSIVEKTPVAAGWIPFQQMQEPLKNSVIQDTSGLIASCQKDIEDMPDDWQKYGWDCKILAKSLSDGADPTALKLTASMAAKLRTALSPK